MMVKEGNLVERTLVLELGIITQTCLAVTFHSVPMPGNGRHILKK